MNNTYLKDFKKLYTDLCNFHNFKIPLCAAETYVSPFVKQGLSSEYEGKYIQGYKNRDVDDDNIGSDEIYPLLCLVEEICGKMYSSEYADARTLSGMNCISIVISALIEKNKKVLLTTEEMGGHPSVAKVLESYGIEYIPIPYDFKKYQVDYKSLNKLIHDNQNDISFLIFSQSHILSQVEFNKINLIEDIGIIYDASQTLGLIGGKQLENPLNFIKQCLVIGGTHKTLPGPTCGLILTNNKSYIDKIDYTISPTLLRNIQPNNIASLCLALIEQIECGEAYQLNIVNTANKLGFFLEQKSINVSKINQNNKYTNTHQLFLNFPENVTNRLYKRALHYNITLNKRISKLYTGIRIGVQEIARYNYTEQDLKKVAELIYLLSKDEVSDEKITNICSDLSLRKNAGYILDEVFM